MPSAPGTQSRVELPLAAHCAARCCRQLPRRRQNARLELTRMGAIVTNTVQLWRCKERPGLYSGCMPRRRRRPSSDASSEGGGAAAAFVTAAPELAEAGPCACAASMVARESPGIRGRVAGTSHGCEPLSVLIVAASAALPAAPCSGAAAVAPAPVCGTHSPALKLLRRLTPLAWQHAGNSCCCEGVCMHPPRMLQVRVASTPCTCTATASGSLTDHKTHTGGPAARGVVTWQERTSPEPWPNTGKGGSQL